MRGKIARAAVRSILNFNHKFDASGYQHFFLMPRIKMHNKVFQRAPSIRTVSVDDLLIDIWTAILFLPIDNSRLAGTE